MDANITLSLRDIYEEFLYNRDVGHEQIMYIIEQQQQELPNDDKQKLQKFCATRPGPVCNKFPLIPKLRISVVIITVVTY